LQIGTCFTTGAVETLFPEQLKFSSPLVADRNMLHDWSSGNATSPKGSSLNATPCHSFVLTCCFDLLQF